MRVLAIDPGNRCGFAVVADGELERSGVWVLKRSDKESKGLRFWRLFHRLAELEAVPDAVAFETKFAVGRASTHNLLNTGGFLGVIRTWCVEQQIDECDVEAVAPASLKKRATGNGKASKADMCAWASQLTGETIRDDNEADAICLAFATYERRKREEEW